MRAGRWSESAGQNLPVRVPAMNWIHLVALVALALATQHYVISPLLNPAYRKNFGHMMKYSDEVIKSHCGSLIGSAHIDAIAIVGAKTEPLQNTSQAHAFQQRVWKQAGSKMRPIVYIGDICASTDETMIKGNKITHIVNLCDKCPNRFPTLRYLNILAPSEDEGFAEEPSQLIFDNMAPILEFINAATQEGGNVLIHSTQGSSRTFLVAAAYLMKSHGWTLDEASGHIMAIRASVKPSDAVLKKLILIAATLHHDDTHVST